MDVTSSVNQAHGFCVFLPLVASGVAVHGADLADVSAQSDHQALVPWLHKYHLLVFYLWPKSGP